MDINNPPPNSDMERFYKFLDKLDPKYFQITKEDWEHMCGITVLRTTINGEVDGVVFNFLEDGSIRTIFGVPEEQIKQRLWKKKYREYIAHMNLWELFWYWMETKND
jgi:hypothetical protein